MKQILEKADHYSDHIEESALRVNPVQFPPQRTNRCSCKTKNVWLPDVTHNYSNRTNHTNKRGVKKKIQKYTAQSRADEMNSGFL